MKTQRLRRLLFTAGIGLAWAVGCGTVQDQLSNLGSMTFTGTVNRAGGSEPIEGANVVLIKLLNKEALESLVEYKKVPDGKGGKKDLLRIKLSNVHNYSETNSEVIKTTTDSTGKFKVEAPINAYLVYTYGPGDPPGTSKDSYGVHFWGINPDTGALTLEDLIGKDLKPEQNNDKIQLSGGPVPPPAPPAATPQTDPASPPAAPAKLATVQAEPTSSTTDLPRGNLIPPAASSDFWKSMKLEYDGGTLDMTGSKEVDKAPIPSGQRSLTLTAELVTAQTDPVYLILQKGFDSTYVTGCDNVKSASTVRVYPVTVNGTTVTYDLVPPGPFYKLYLAKVATQTKDGEAPTTVTSSSETFTVGKRSCDYAVPERPFMATLAWDSEVDLDLHVSKYNAAAMKTAKTEEEIGAALVDQANWTMREGEKLTLDVDNVYAFGPENNGDSKAETTPENFCYLVRVNYFSGSKPLVKANVDVSYVKNESGKKSVLQYLTKFELKESGEWYTVGAYGPDQCATLMTKPSTPENVIPYPSLSSCTNPGSCQTKGNMSGKYNATVTLEKSSFASGDSIKVDYSNMPGTSGDWITIVPKSYPDNSWCSWQWSTGTSGTQYYGGLPAGEYEVRMYYNWSEGECEVIGRKAFTVQ